MIVRDYCRVYKKVMDDRWVENKMVMIFKIVDKNYYLKKKERKIL